MKNENIMSWLILPLLLLALAGCGPSSDDTTASNSGNTVGTGNAENAGNTENTGNTDNTEEAACTTGETFTVENTYLPQITYTEVDEGSAANDARAAAEAIAGSNTILTGQGSFQFPGAGCVDCDDFYSLAVAEGDELEFELSTVSGMTAFLYLYNGDETTPQVYSDSGDNVKRLSHTIPAGVTELIIYVNTYQGTGEYTLKVTTPVEPVTITETTSAECLANLEGALTDAINGGKVAGAFINLREGVNVKTGTVDFTTTSDSEGNYEFADIDAGEYTVEIVKDGYITHYIDITLKGEKTTEKKFQLSPSLAAGELMRVVMSWGASPHILDSYLNGPKSTGGTFTVKYYNRTGDGASLDRDATQGYGPETITFTAFNEGTYTYWINDYSNGSYGSNTTSTKLAESGANVTVYDSTGIAKQYKVPSGAGTKWNVFTITVDAFGNKTINDVNTLGVWSETP